MRNLGRLGVGVMLWSLVACTGVAEPADGSTTTTEHEPSAQATTTTVEPDGLEFRIPTLSEVPPLSDTDLLSPTASLMGGGSTSQALYNGIEREVASCMQQRGWTYAPILQDESFGDPLTVGEKREFVGEYGYGIFTMPAPTSDPTREAIERNSQYVASLSPQEKEAYRQDYDGAVGEGDAPSEGSCLADAQAATGTMLFDEAAMNEMRELFVGATSTPQASEADEAYSRCMAGLGYDVEVPADVQLMVMEQGSALPRAEAAELELRTAGDDFECQLATRIPWSHAVDLEIVRVLVERYPEYASGLGGSEP